jgi:hypothetical protein
MLYLVASVFSNTGVSKASGKPFQMNRATVLTPFSERNTPNFQSHGSGLNAVELSVADHVFAELDKHFSTAFKRAPVPVDLETTIDGDGRLQIIGFKPASPAAAVA